MTKGKRNVLIVISIITIAIIIFKAFNIEKHLMKAFYPRKYSEYVERYASEYNVDDLLVYAVIKAESNFKSDATSNSDAKGLMQLMDTTASEISSNIATDVSFESSQLFDAETNIRIGVKYLSELLEKYDGNLYVALAAYNAGIGNVDRWINEGTIKADGSDIENIPYKETNNYVRKIVRDYDIYKQLYS